MVTFHPKHPMWDQDLQFTPQSETTSTLSLLYGNIPRKHAIFPSLIWGKDGEEGVGLNVPFILSKIVVKLDDEKSKDYCKADTT